MKLRQIDGVLVHQGSFATVRVTERQNTLNNVPHDVTHEALVVGIPTSGEVRIRFTAYRGQEVECWIRLSDGMAEYHKTWVENGEELKKLHAAWKRNQPRADIIQLRKRKTSP